MTVEPESVAQQSTAESPPAGDEKPKKPRHKKSKESKDARRCAPIERLGGDKPADTVMQRERMDASIDQDGGISQGEAVEGGGVSEQRKTKKGRKKRSRREGDEVVNGNESARVQEDDMNVDDAALHEKAQSNGEKKKKRKRTQDPTEDGPSADSSEKKKKKKRRTAPSVNASQEPSSTEAPVPTQATTSSLSEPPRDTKHKKDKQKSISQVSPEPAPALSSAGPTVDEAAAFLTRHSITIHSQEPVTPILSFEKLEIPAKLKSAFAGFKEPTPIQACAWPPALDGRDVVGIAETGSGKTLAFGIPGLVRIASSSYSHSKPTALVVAPTRELAIQIHDAISPLGTSFHIQSVAIFGGVDKAGQIKALQKRKNQFKAGAVTTRIVVGTPGRILDLVNDGVLDLSEVHYLVLDEADRMLDKGFENDIRQIIGFAREGKDRQTLMFSATWPDAVRRLASSFLRDPVRVTVGSDDLTANSKVEQAVEVFDDSRSKDSRLIGHLRRILPNKPSHASIDTVRVLIFALYKKEAARVEGMLRSKGFSVGALQGDMNQSARMAALQQFKTGETPLLVATDVAARGLDIPNVAAVINYTFPLTIEDYIHRIGRTGRGGKSGKSITFFTGDAHERSLAGELARVLRESGFESEDLKEKFPMTIKKKTHSAYGAFYRDDIAAPAKPTKIVF